MKRCALALIIVLCTGPAAVAQVPGDETGSAVQGETGPSLGLILDAEEVPWIPRAVKAERPLYVRFTARWSDVERQAGSYDWSDLEEAVTRAGSLGLRPVICLTGANPLYVPEGSLPSPLVGESVNAWTAFVRSAVRALGTQVSVWEIWDGPARPDPIAGTPAFEPRIYAFLLKSSALAAQAEAKRVGVEALVAQGALDAGNIEWQRQVWEGDSSAYTDILPLRVEARGQAGEVGAALSGLLQEVVLHPPAPALWVLVGEAEGAPRNAAADGAVEALAGSAVVALIRPSGTGDRIEQEVRWSIGLHEALAKGFAPAPGSGLEVRGPDGEPVEGARFPGRFLSDRDFSTLVVCDLSVTGLPANEQAQVVIDSDRIRNVRIFDPAADRSFRTAPLPDGENDTRRVLRIPVGPHPVAIFYQEAVTTPGFELPPEELEIAGRRGLSAEEIIARFQKLQKIQDDNLDRWAARGRVDFHFKLAQAGSTVDVSIDSNYYWERGGQLEWEQTEYYVNGNKVRWKNIPELPYIQPEKVVRLPLDLSLDKTYAYRLVGEDRVGDRDAYVLAFEPVDPDSPTSLYRGRVWIDKESFARLKASVVQNNLEAPVLANEEVDHFEPVEGPGGQDYWMLDRIAGQQVWTVGGRNFIVRREISFESFDINPAKDRFDSARETAYASRHLMMRDTDQGYRYLVKNDDGSRTVKDTVDTRQWFAAAGAYKDSSLDNVVPLAGVNWFDYDFAGKNIQMNVLFAGVLVFFNATQPDLFGRKIDVTVDATGFALKRNDKIFLGDDELLAERIRFRSQNASVRLGVPLGQFVKLSLTGDVSFYSYFTSSESDDALAALRNDPVSPRDLSWVLPVDHQLYVGTLEAEFNRRGWTLSAYGSWATRSDWEPWGLFDNDTGEFVNPEFDPTHERYRKWGATAFKEWYLPKFQKVRGEINYMDGAELDRFSRYQFSFFGDTRLSGFAGTGVRFDRGFAARAGYAFNLFEIVRVDATAETARVDEEDTGLKGRKFTGVGLSGNFVGPWKTVFSIGYGRAVASDIPDLEGSQEIWLAVLKLF